jgi:hypothetical protein
MHLFTVTGFIDTKKVRENTIFKWNIEDFIFSKNGVFF